MSQHHTNVIRCIIDRLAQDAGFNPNQPRAANGQFGFMDNGVSTALQSSAASRNQIFAGSVNGSLEFYFQGLDGVPNPSALPLAAAYINLNGDAGGNGYKNFYKALEHIGINRRNAMHSAVYLVQPGMSEADVLADIKARLGAGFKQKLNASLDVQDLLMDRVRAAKAGQLLNITDFWQAAIGDAVLRAYDHPGGVYFRDAIDNNGTVPVFSKILGDFNFKGIVAVDDLAPPAYRRYARTSVGVDVVVFLASTLMPIKGVGAAVRGEAAFTGGRIGFAALEDAVTQIRRTPAPGATFQSRINIAAKTEERAKKIRSTPLRKNGEKSLAGFHHVVSGHFDRMLGPGRSVFSISQEKLIRLLQSDRVVWSPAIKKKTGGQFVRIADVGEVIGNSTLKKGGRSTTMIEVYTDFKGNLISAFPY